MLRATFGARMLGTLAVALSAVAVVAAAGPAQDEPKAAGPGQEAAAIPKPEVTKFHRILRKDAGVWDAEVKAWMAPGQEPDVSQGVERSRMLGGIWLVSDFEGSFGGAPFRGHGTSGYDTAKNKFVGTWIDTMTTNMMTLEGDYDDARGELVLEGETSDPTGQAYQIRNVTTYPDENTRVMTMSMRPAGDDGEYLKMMEITYKRRPVDAAKKAARKKAAN